MNPEDKSIFKLDSLSAMKNYYNCILQELSPFIGNRLLEVGAGIGTFTNALLGLENIQKIFLLEPSPVLFDEIKRKFNDDPRIEFICSRAEDIGSETLARINVDTIIFLNVLEHIKDDEGLLKRYSYGLKPGSRVLTFSPAFQILFGRLDASAGHYRRYSKNSIKQKLEAAGFDVVYLRYFNFVGFFRGFFLSSFYMPKVLTKTA